MFEEIGIQYQKPEEFTTALNDLVQALRNITFILQSEKSKIPDFDNWYAPYQAKMKTDKILRWLVDARNYVVKRGDLEKESHLTLRIKNHLDQVLFAAVLNPYVSLEEAVVNFKKVVKLKLPKHYKDETIIEAERKWVVESFPKAEITDVLIYCLSILTKIVYDAHVVCSVNPMVCDHNTFVKPGQDFMITIRNDVKKGRILKVHYSQNTILTPKERSVSLFDKISGSDETHYERAKKRYGVPKEIMALMNTGGKDLPFSQVRYHIETAKHLFSIDGYVDPVAFLYFPDRHPEIIRIQMDKPEDRYLMAERIAEKVEETHCAAVLIVGEMWLGELPKEGEDLVPPRLQKNKKEQVMILAASPERTEMHFMGINRKPDGTATLDKEFKESVGNIGFLTRVYKVWEYHKR
ncbi:MAG: hypothetical protein HYT93_03430 [Parcubacteria group bacterium]|nr:hypothetical protein [Parcubacteria group bacterium]